MALDRKAFAFREKVVAVLGMIFTLATVSKTAISGNGPNSQSRIDHSPVNMGLKKRPGFNKYTSKENDVSFILFPQLIIHHLKHNGNYLLL